MAILTKRTGERWRHEFKPPRKDPSPPGAGPMQVQVLVENPAALAWLPSDSQAHVGELEAKASGWGSVRAEFRTYDGIPLGYDAIQVRVEDAETRQKRLAGVKKRPVVVKIDRAAVPKREKARLQRLKTEKAAKRKR